jgi:hypothetical protein
MAVARDDLSDKSLPMFEEYEKKKRKKTDR